jgi:hypothetical protein
MVQKFSLRDAAALVRSGIVNKAEAESLIGLGASDAKALVARSLTKSKKHAPPHGLDEWDQPIDDEEEEEEEEEETIDVAPPGRRMRPRKSRKRALDDLEARLPGARLLVAHAEDAVMTGNETMARVNTIAKLFQQACRGPNGR